jgi:3-polyprenyl-4-hydroxybenzoate decarboxylase
MKIALAAVAATLMIAPAAQAQSLHETHQLVWAPAGKTPVAHWRMRDRQACPAAQSHHQAGKTALPAATKCVASVSKPRNRG